MSRESKLGLLVATAFILVVGLLLSDHVTVANRQPPAQLTARYDDVARGLSLPKQEQPEQKPTVEFVSPVPTKPQPVDIATLEVRRGETEPTQGQMVQPEPIDIWDNDPVAAHPEPIAVDAAGVDPLAQVAQAAGEPVERVDQTNQTPAPSVAVRSYVAQPGDSLGRMAARFFGKDTSDNRSKLMALNESLADNPDLVVAGRSYRVPADAVQAAAVRPAAKPKSNIYTVQPGDSLWRIAARQLGDGNRGEEIAALNADVLPDPDRLQVGMDLRLPS
ncbi:MAG: LysM peptidoglycan-binding domain-containing protein [Planctomycetota bacterium]